jgi:hypothetical protein
VNGLVKFDPRDVSADALAAAAAKVELPHLNNYCNNFSLERVGLELILQSKIYLIVNIFYHPSS